MRWTAAATGTTLAVTSLALVAMSHCRAGLFDHFSSRPKCVLPRQCPAPGCDFGFHATSWRPWNTCCGAGNNAGTTAPGGTEYPVPGYVPYESVMPGTPPTHYSAPLSVPPGSTGPYPPFNDETAIPMLRGTQPSFGPSGPVEAPAPRAPLVVPGLTPTQGSVPGQPSEVPVPGPFIPTPPAPATDGLPAIPEPPLPAIPGQPEVRWRSGASYRTLQPAGHWLPSQLPGQSSITGQGSPVPAAGWNSQSGYRAEGGSQPGSSDSRWQIMPGYYQPQQSAVGSERVEMLPHSHIPRRR